MAEIITKEDVEALEDKLVIIRPLTHTDGTEDYWVKGSLNAILEHFIPEGSAVVAFGNAVK